MTTTTTKTETFMRPISMEKQAELSVEQSNLALRRITIEGEKSLAAATFNAQLKEIRKKIETLAKAVREGSIEETIEVREEHDVNTRKVTTFEASTGTKLRDRDMTDQEVRAALGIDTPLFDGVTEEQAQKPKRGRRRTTTSEPDTSIIDESEGGPFYHEPPVGEEGEHDAAPSADEQPTADYWYCAPCDVTIPARKGDEERGTMKHAKCGWMMSFNKVEGGSEAPPMNGQPLRRVRGRSGRKSKDSAEV